jgi:hypothetical protein
MRRHVRNLGTSIELCQAIGHSYAHGQSTGLEQPSRFEGNRTVALTPGIGCHPTDLTERYNCKMRRSGHFVLSASRRLVGRAPHGC